ncbi:DNA base-flipping protein [bacterium HR15]|nr:DNA base-flipping protein [bacterium HR15]
MARSAAEQVYALVRRVPAGRVVSYGQIAEQVPPITARQVGRWMAFAPDDVPWWRVVGADGTLCIARRDPMLAQLQRAYLESEGVPFDDTGRVCMAQCQWEL